MHEKKSIRWSAVMGAALCVFLSGNAHAQAIFERDLTFRNGARPSAFEDTEFFAARTEERDLVTIANGVMTIDTLAPGDTGFYVISTPEIGPENDILMSVRFRALAFDGRPGNHRGAASFVVNNGAFSYAVGLSEDGIHYGGDLGSGGELLEMRNGAFRTYALQIEGGENTAKLLINGVERAEFEGVPTTETNIMFGDFVSFESDSLTEWSRILIAAGDDLFTETAEGIPSDFDFDGVRDFVVYHPQSGNWYIRMANDTNGARTVQWGYPGTVPVAADLTGDGNTDLAVYDRTQGTWHILSNETEAETVNWGLPGAIPVAADYTGDGQAEVAVFHRPSGNWYILLNRNGEPTADVVNWGWNETLPVPADYDGDGQADIAVYHPQTGQWYILTGEGENAQMRTVSWGFATAHPVPADYNGDGRIDFAVYGLNDGNWYILYTNGENGEIGDAEVVNWGFPGAVPVPGDYDNQGRTDLAVYDVATGRWYVLFRETGVTRVVDWGWNEALPPDPLVFEVLGR